ncbi:MAG: S-layer protein [Meiothermus sp.]
MILAVQQSTPSFRDVPAGHWAKEAVDFIAECGLIQGFEDGTYRGNQNLTRYQAALIFYRFIQAGSTCPGQAATPEDQATVQKGMEEVSRELETLRAQIAGFGETNTAQDARLQALEEQIKNLSTAQAQPAAPAPDTSTLEARIAALEEELKKVTEAQAQPAQPAAPDTSALETRIAALEEQIKNLTAATTAEQEASQQSRLEALEGQVRALNDQVNTLRGELNTLRTDIDTLRSTAATPPAQPAPPAPEVTTPAPVTPVTPEPVPAPAPLPRLYFGLGAAYPIEPPAAGPIEQALGISAFIGSHDVIFGFGPRVGVDYSLGSGSVNVTAYLVRNFNRGAFFDPYLGLGLRYDTTSAAALPLYGDAVVGAGFNFSRNFGLFLEGNPGFGDDLSLRFGVRAGLKVAF